MSEQFHVERLHLDDVSEIGSFLNTVWGASYGSSARPDFTPSYLQWLYGGPDSERHALVGVRHDRSLVAFKALLFRPTRYRGRCLRAHVTTHLAIHPGLSLQQRVDALIRITVPHSFLTDRDLCPDAPVDLIFAFYEEEKNIPRNTVHLMEQYGLVRSFVPFQQAIANRATVQAAVDHARTDRRVVRQATMDDAPVIEDLFNRHTARQSLAITMTAERIEHHLFGLPNSRVVLLEEGGTPTGFVAFYLLDVARAGVRSQAVIVEFLIVEGSRWAAALLLDQALEFSSLSGARGVVMENPTYVGLEGFRDCGLVPSARRMLLSTVSERPLDLESAFVCDVK